MKTTITFLVLFISTYSFSQIKDGYSIGLGYSNNAALHSHGVHGRVTVPILSHLSIGAFGTYFGKANAIQEYYLGIRAKGNLFYLQGLKGYLVADGERNNWINYKEYNNPLSQSSKFLFTAGCGFSYDMAMFHIFMDGTYSIQYKEARLNIGAAINLNRLKNKELQTHKGARYSKKRGRYPMVTK